MDRVIGAKVERRNGSEELSPSMRRHYQPAVAKNWECDGGCGNSFSGSHPWLPEKDAVSGRKKYFCNVCAYARTGWWNYDRRPRDDNEDNDEDDDDLELDDEDKLDDEKKLRGIGTLFLACMKAKTEHEKAWQMTEFAQQSETQQSAPQHVRLEGVAMTYGGSSSSSMEVDSCM